MDYININIYVRSSKYSKFMTITKRGFRQWRKDSKNAHSFESVSEVIEYIKENLDVTKDPYRYDVYSTYKDDDGFTLWHYHYIV